jgi:hypothetical protein
MTAKEEALELYNNFYNTSSHPHHVETRQQIAKKCALIAVEFAADQFEKYCLSEIGLHWTKDDQRTDGSWDHFRYIKEEIEKL